MLRKYWLVIVTLVLACAQLARSYATLTQPYLDLHAYADGSAAMPYQGRMLMMWPLHWAQHSRALAQFCVGRLGAFRNPSLLVVTATACLCLLLTCWVVTALYLNSSRRRSLPWLPAALLLVIAAVQYVLHERNFQYPYDLPSLFFFTLGMYLIHSRRVWWMVLLFPIATLNREVTLFLILLLVIDRFVAEGVAACRRWQFVAQTALLCVIWISVEKYVHHRFTANPTEMHARAAMNLHDLLNPAYWPQLAAIGAYLLPFVYIHRARIADKRLRSYLWVLLPWTAMMFYFGEIIELRIFGELSGVVAVAAVLAWEETPAHASASA